MTTKSRKEEYAEITRQALLDSALELFMSKGFQRTSIEDIVQRARVTRGALYHHFKSKEEVFAVVYSGIARELVVRIESEIDKTDGHWNKALAGCRAFLDCCIDPGFKSIRLDDAIGALGWRKWREIDSSFTMRVLKDLLSEMRTSGELSVDSVDHAANMVYSLLVEAALNIARAKDKRAVHDEMIQVIDKMLTGLRSQAGRPTSSVS